MAQITIATLFVVLMLLAGAHAKYPALMYIEEGGHYKSHIEVSMQYRARVFGTTQTSERKIKKYTTKGEYFFKFPELEICDRNVYMAGFGVKYINGKRSDSRCARPAIPEPILRGAVTSSYGHKYCADTYWRHCYRVGFWKECKCKKAFTIQVSFFDHNNNLMRLPSLKGTRFRVCGRWENSKLRSLKSKALAFLPKRT